MAVKDYYETLEVAETAAKTEIKKAYFNLVRRYPPEKEPEKFKEYRKAYEVLFDDNSRKQYDSVKSIPEFYRDIFEYAMKMMAAGAYEAAIEQYKIIIEQYPDLVIVNAMLAEAYSMNGNTGNAVKILEKIVKLEPENMAYQKALGTAYGQRGFNKKALKQFKKTLKLEPDHSDLYADIINLHLESEEYRLAQKHLLPGLKCAEEHGQDNARLLICGVVCCIFNRDNGGLAQYLEALARKMTAEPSRKETLVNALLLQLFSAPPEMDYLDEYIRVINFIAGQAPELEEVRRIQQEITRYQMLNALEEDDRIPEVIAALTYKTLDGCTCPSCQVGQLSMEMTIMENITEMRKALHYLRTNYPDLFALNAPFYNDVLNAKKERRLFEMLYKKYLQYKRQYPEEFCDDVWDDEDMAEDNEPYIRQERKIGRNDPCPCGSGKKYKKCCGANN